MHPTSFKIYYPDIFKALKSYLNAVIAIIYSTRFFI